jgi:hypothetical protein
MRVGVKRQIYVLLLRKKAYLSSQKNGIYEL